MKELTKAQILNKVLSMQAAISLLAKDCDQLIKELGDPPPRKSKNNEDEIRIQRILINKERSRKRNYTN